MLLTSYSSVPRNDTTDTRPAVVLSMKRLDTHFPIDDGKRVVCLAGCGISTLATSIQSWFPDRESHSILGSTFIQLQPRVLRLVPVVYMFEKDQHVQIVHYIARLVVTNGVRI